MKSGDGPSVGRPGTGTAAAWLAGVFPSDVLLAGVALCGFFDYPLWKLSWKLGWGLLIVSILIDREARPWRRLGLVAALSGVTCTAAAILRALTDGPAPRGDVLYWLWYYKAAPQLVLTLWFAMPLLAPASPSSPSFRHPEIRPLAWLLVLLALWNFAALPSAVLAENSISIYRLDAGNYLIAMIALIRLWGEGPRALRVTRAVLVGGALFHVAGAGIVALRAALSGATVIDEMVRDGLIGMDSWRRSWRLHFPMKGHNRLGSAMFLNFFILLAASRSAARPWLRYVLLGTAAAAFGLSALTMTRGAPAAIVIGTLPLLVFVGRKRLLLLAVAAVLVLPFVSRGPLAYFKTILTPSEWTKESSSVGMRRYGWDGAIMMMRDRPWSGIGYGAESFYEVYRTSYQQRTGDREAKRHAHNVWLEIGAEGGLPALAFFAALMMLRWRILLRAIRAAPREPALLICLGYEIASLAFFLFFHMHKRNQGVLFWGAWMWSTLYCLDRAADQARRITPSDSSDSISAAENPASASTDPVSAPSLGAAD